jgi:Na+/H+-translocating membrane pyrophosphatase
LGVLLGAALTWLCARSATQLGVEASLQTSSAAGKALDGALHTAVQTGSAISLGTEALSALGLLGLFGSAFAFAGGTTFAPTQAFALGADLAAILASFPLGAALAALLCQRGGGIYQASAAVGRDLVAEHKFGLLRDDPRNPTLVGELAGDHLGQGATRVAISFVVAATSHVALLALGLAAGALQPTPSPQLVMLPLLVRGFFVLASGFGAGVVRTEEMTNPSAGLLRGYASTTVIGLSGLCGASLWLAHDYWLQMLGAGALGAAAAAAVGASVSIRMRRPTSTFREASETLRVGAGALQSLGGALELAMLPTLCVGVAASASFHLGARSGLPSGGLWTSLVTWAALLGAAPFAAAVSCVGTVASGARGVSALGPLDADAQRRLTRLDEALAVAAGARAQLIVGGVVAAVLSALALPPLARQALRIDVGLLEPGVTWSGALGAAAILSYVGSCARAAMRGAREVGGEVDRQLRRFPREHGVSQVPADFSPSYKTCVDLAARLGQTRVAVGALGILAVPACLALGLRLTYPGVDGPLAVDGLMSCVLFAGLVGFATAFTLDAAQSVLNAAQRALRAPATTETSSFAALGAADILGHAAGPAAHALLIGTSALALALAPFMN